ncbi:uncharacterized protein [Apostichopus japonicus]|uniref:uncharacterized protein n=1 Tax=Stichopus japonicus TaxID=307972 RepID=UPI003AB614FD
MRVSYSHKKSSESLTKFTAKSWQTYVKCAEVWSSLEGGKFSSIARESRSIWSNSECGFDSEHLGYHRSCYQDFTNKSTIEGASKSKRTNDEDEGAGPSTPKKRRSAVLPLQRVLPHQCIFHLACTTKTCGRSGLKFSKGRRHGSPQTEKLFQCLTRDAEKRLKQAAQQKCDEKLFLQIGGKDLIAIEIRYHKSCYRNYFQESLASNIDSRAIPQYKEAFREIIKTVESSVIMQGEVLKMSKLNQMFINLVAEKGMTMTDFRTERLKKNLMSHFGEQISFWRPKKRTRCELVYSDYTPKYSSLERSGESSSSQDEISAESEIEEREPVVGKRPHVNAPRELYHAAQLLRQVIGNVSGVSWPPNSSKLSDECLSTLIPSELHNFLAWVISPTPIDPNIEDNSKVDVPKGLQVRVYAIAQDIIEEDYCFLSK